MKFALCNEVLASLTFEQQCKAAGELGYDGLEVAPFTLAEDPMTITDAQALEFKRIASDNGVEISGLHWLLVAPAGLSIVSADAAVRERTCVVIERLVELCQVMGGKYLVHGSPKQRSVPAGETAATARERALACFARAAKRSEQCGVTYCVEPLSPQETDFITKVEDAVQVVKEINSSAFKTMIDCNAAGNGEQIPAAQLMAKWMPTGHIAHVQVNDPSRRGPGQGDMKFAPIVRTLLAMEAAGHYKGIVAVEPFIYVPDGMGSAARAIGYLKGLVEGSESHG